MHRSLHSYSSSPPNSSLPFNHHSSIRQSVSCNDSNRSLSKMPIFMLCRLSTSHLILRRMNSSGMIASTFFLSPPANDDKDPTRIRVLGELSFSDRGLPSGGVLGNKASSTLLITCSAPAYAGKGVVLMTEWAIWSCCNWSDVDQKSALKF